MTDLTFIIRKSTNFIGNGQISDRRKMAYAIMNKQFPTDGMPLRLCRKDDIILPYPSASCTSSEASATNKHTRTPYAQTK